MILNFVCSLKQAFLQFEAAGFIPAASQFVGNLIYKEVKTKTCFGGRQPAVLSLCLGSCPTDIKSVAGSSAIAVFRLPPGLNLIDKGSWFQGDLRSIE